MQSARFLVISLVIVAAVCAVRTSGLGMDSPFGVNVHAPRVATLYDRIQDAGIEWMRVDFNWLTFEPGQDAYDCYHYKKFYKGKT